MQQDATLKISTLKSSIALQYLHAIIQHKKVLSKILQMCLLPIAIQTFTCPALQFIIIVVTRTAKFNLMLMQNCLLHFFIFFFRHTLLLGCIILS
jgi:hypothetical protein